MLLFALPGVRTRVRHVRVLARVRACVCSYVCFLLLCRQAGWSRPTVREEKGLKTWEHNVFKVVFPKQLLIDMQNLGLSEHNTFEHNTAYFRRIANLTSSSPRNVDRCCMKNAPLYLSFHLRRRRNLTLFVLIGIICSCCPTLHCSAILFSAFKSLSDSIFCFRYCCSSPFCFVRQTCVLCM